MSQENGRKKIRTKAEVRADIDALFRATRRLHAGGTLRGDKERPAALAMLAA
jgi:hypothetical protein